MKLHSREDPRDQWLAGVLALSLLAPAIAFAQAGSGTTACLEGTPATPVEEFRTISGQGTFEMWPDFFKPADALGQPLPSSRDSTVYNGFQRPGRLGGLEFFNDLDIVDDSSGTYLYLAYNSGFQIWDIGGAFAAAPQLLGQRDGWDGDFHDFEPTLTEFYLLIWDIAAINPPGNNATLVALAADSPAVGLTIWDATSRTEPTQLYQDTAKTGIQVAAANIGGRSYAFFGASNGIHVYDMTRARQIGPCFENTSEAAALCGGNGNPVWRGRLEPWPWNRGRYLDVLKTSISGQTRHFLAVSDAFVSTPLQVELREITDVTALPPAAPAIVEGLHTLSFGVDLFQTGGRYYLGVADLDDLAIYDVTLCLTSGCTLGNPQASFPTAISDFSYVQYSESNGRPFLYKGFHNLCSRPPSTSEPNLEYLLNLENLATGGAVVDVRGEEYLDPANQRRIDYWSAYYDQATGGFSAFAPHGGQFHGVYFYRVAQTVFDIHEWIGPGPPTVIFEDGFELGDLSLWD